MPARTGVSKFNSLAVVALCLLPATAAQDGKAPYPNGVWGASCLVTVVGEGVLEVVVEPERFRMEEKRLKLKVTEESKLEQVDLRLVDGKIQWSMKPIKLTDLHPNQPISVLLFSDGRELTLLRGAASGDQLANKDLAVLVDKLGGKMQRITFLKNRLVYEVDLKGTKTTDADLRLIAHVKGLYRLNLAFTGVTDQGVAHLAGAPELTHLDLTGTKVTDAVVPSLRLLPRLGTIELAQTAVTDKGMADLVKDQTISVCRVGLGDRAQYRVLQEYVDGKVWYNYLMIGNTHFGLYLPDKVAAPPDHVARDQRREATTYYHRHGPVGQVLAKLEWVKPAGVRDYPSDARLSASLVGLAAPFGARQMHLLPALQTEPAIGVVRLNAGTVAAYGRPFQHVHFYNSTPEIKTLSLPPKGQPVHFGYIRDALERGCRVTVIEGPERATFSKKAPKRYYSALFIDLARNDLRDVMTEFMTQEALADLMDSLTETGVVGFHTSHRYQNLNLPILDAAKALNLSWKVGQDTGNLERDQHHFGSEWVMIARKAEYLAHLTDVKDRNQTLTWSVPASTGRHLWRDGQPQDLKALTRPPLK